MQRQTKRYGWIPDLPDHRDHLYAAPVTVLKALPTEVDLRDQCPKVYDQGELGSCTANAIAGAIEFDQLKQKMDPTFTPSRLFIYYNERVRMGPSYVGVDSGAQLRDGVKSVAQQGAPPETLWPYDVNRFTQQPPAAAYTEAAKHKASSYQRVARSLGQMRGCLAAGFPFVFGFTVYESFEGADVAETGRVPMPSAGEQVLGGHAVLAVGYNDPQQRFVVRNSWGDQWGEAGYFTMPYEYLTSPDLSDDFWTIRLVS
jgi:C1A family cysteine protease